MLEVVATGAEVILRFRAWVESLPLSERDMPYLSFQDKLWTPLEVLREMEAGTPAGKLLQEAEEKLLRRS
ncbi:hypothetical protein ES703_66067 [subsurface metagenome]